MLRIDQDMRVFGWKKNIFKIFDILPHGPFIQYVNINTKVHWKAQKI